MSYILDALRKSEREREGSAVPLLRAPPRTVTGYRRMSPAVAAGVVLIVAASAAAWLFASYFLKDTGNTPAPPVPSDPSETPAGSRAATPAENPESRAPSGGAPAVRDGASRARDEAAAPDGTDSGVHPRVADLSLTVVSYSDTPERRFVMIDQRIVRESEAVGDGVVVKRILPDGVILSVGDDEVLLEPR